MKRIFEIPWVLFEKSVNLYFDWPKSWIWRTLEQITNNFSKWHFYNASKEVFWPKKFLNFMHGFKSAILAEWKNCQNGTFEFTRSWSLSFSNMTIFWQKTSFEALWKCHFQKIFITFSRVRQIQDLGQSKYKLRLFSKRTHGISKILFNLGSCEFLARLESKIRKCLFFDGSLL